MKINNFGTLYIVATPLGNLADITFRAVDILKTVNLIAAEDTRHSKFLLQHYGISTPVKSLHEHNEQQRTLTIIELLEKGDSVALISDAGTPLISDPGYSLVKKVRERGITVTPIPGPCAAIAALSALGLPTDKFVFEGFLPSKSKQRLESLTALSNETRTMVFYESPHRIESLLNDMKIVFGGERIVGIAREITKLFETIHSDKLDILIEWLHHDSNQQRGEFVVIVEGAKLKHEKLEEMTKLISILLESVSVKQAVDIASKITGERKNDLYALALQLKQQNSQDS